MTINQYYPPLYTKEAGVHILLSARLIRLAESGTLPKSKYGVKPEKGVDIET